MTALDGFEFGLHLSGDGSALRVSEDSDVIGGRIRRQLIVVLVVRLVTPLCTDTFHLAP